MGILINGKQYGAIYNGTDVGGCCNGDSICRNEYVDCHLESIPITNGLNKNVYFIGTALIGSDDSMKNTVRVIDLTTNEQYTVTQGSGGYAQNNHWVIRTEDNWYKSLVNPNAYFSLKDREIVTNPFESLFPGIANIDSISHQPSWTQLSFKEPYYCLRKSKIDYGDDLVRLASLLEPMNVLATLPSGINFTYRQHWLDAEVVDYNVTGSLICDYISLRSFLIEVGWDNDIPVIVRAQDSGIQFPQYQSVKFPVLSHDTFCQVQNTLVLSQSVNRTDGKIENLGARTAYKRFEDYGLSLADLSFIRAPGEIPNCIGIEGRRSTIAGKYNIIKMLDADGECKFVKLNNDSSINTVTHSTGTVLPSPNNMNFNFNGHRYFRDTNYLHKVILDVERKLKNG